MRKSKRYNSSIFDIIPVDSLWFWIGSVLTISIVAVFLTILKVNNILW